MVDKEELFNRLNEIDEGINYLSNISPEILKDKEKFVLARYYLQLILEAIFTIGNQIIANNNYKKPANYRDILKILAEKKVIETEFERELDFAVRLRNELVHMYWKASPEDLLEIKETKLQYFKKFIKQITEFIK